MSTIKQHNFSKHHFAKPTWCDHCKNFLWGVSYQGVLCSDCDQAYHEKCMSKAAHCPHHPQSSDSSASRELKDSSAPKELKDSSASKEIKDSSASKEIKNSSSSLLTAATPASAGVRSSHVLKDHDWKKTHFNKLTWCDGCEDFIWGVGKQGYICKECGYIAHGRCLDKTHVCQGAFTHKEIPPEILKQAEEDYKKTGGAGHEHMSLSFSQGIIRAGGGPDELKHEFRRVHFDKPTWCDHCTKFIWGIGRQGCVCRVCEVSVHDSCLNVVRACTGSLPQMNVRMNDELVKLANEMKGSKDGMKWFNEKDQTFCAADCVDWIAKRESCGRDVALDISQQLQSLGFIKSVEPGKKFRDGNLVFTFAEIYHHPDEHKNTGDSNRRATVSHVSSPSLLGRVGEDAASQEKAYNELLELCKAMRDKDTGIADYSTKYAKSFSGQAAIDWLVANVNGLTERKKARQLGQKLMNSNLLFHIFYEKPFLDGTYLYRLRDPELMPIASKMLDPKLGLPTLENKNVFAGKDTCQWFIKVGLVGSMKEAVDLGNKLMKNGIIVTVTKSGEETNEPFVDKNSRLFTFTRTIKITVDPNLLEIANKMVLAIPTEYKTFFGNCFSGSDAVAWIIKNYQVPTRVIASQIGERLVLSKILKSTNPSKFTLFADKGDFYYVIAHESVREWNEYYEKPFVPSGYIRFHLIAAADLKSADINGLSDPFVELKYGGQTKKTRAIAETLSPIWDEALFFEIDPSIEMVEFNFFDYDLVGDPDPLGQARLNVKKLSNDSQEWYQLDTVGRFHVRITSNPKTS